jgi:hypothetical protein
MLAMDLINRPCRRASTLMSSRRLAHLILPAVLMKVSVCSAAKSSSPSELIARNKTDHPRRAPWAAEVGRGERG